MAGGNPDRFRHSCGGKVPYTTQAKAKKVAKGCHRAFDDKVHEYKCDHCGWWHVGNALPKEAKQGTVYKRQKRPVTQYLDAAGY
jgi:hypothetical protein